VISSTLTGCDLPFDTDSGSPNGYRFYRIKNGGDKAGAENRALELAYFRGSVHISDNGIITFDAVSSEKRCGIVQLGLDMDALQPKIEWEHITAMTDENLPDGRYVANFKAMDVNCDGNIAVDVMAKRQSGSDITHQMSGVYLQTDIKEGFQPVLTYGQKMDGDSVFTTGQFGDIDLHDDNEMMLTGHFRSADDPSAHGQGVMYLPKASVGDSQMLLSSGDFVPFSNHAYESFGLVDMHDNGHYAVSGQAASLTSSKDGEDPVSQSLIISGNVSASENTVLGAAEPMTVGLVKAPCFYGPRVAPSGKVYSIGWDDQNDNMHLYHGADKVISSGDVSPMGNTALYFGTGSVAGNGSLFYTVTSSATNGMIIHELVYYNGTSHTVLLTSGETLSDGSAPVEHIIFGGTTKHVDSQNRLVFYCTFTDGSKSLVVGIPA